MLVTNESGIAYQEKDSRSAIPLVNEMVNILLEQTKAFRKRREPERELESTCFTKTKQNESIYDCNPPSSSTKASASASSRMILALSLENPPAFATLSQSNQNVGNQHREFENEKIHKLTLA